MMMKIDVATCISLYEQKFQVATGALASPL